MPARAPRSNPIQPPHHCRARASEPAPAPQLEQDPDILGAFLSDAAHVPGGFAAGVAFPADVTNASCTELSGEDEIASMRAVKRALDPSGKLALVVLFD